MVSYQDGLSIRQRVGANPDAPLTIDFDRKPVVVDPVRLSESTSKGPNNDYAIKPDLLGVGTSVYTAAPGSSYAVGSGTSFSSPMIAGAAAVLKAARPGLSAEQYRSLLINAAGAFGSGLPLQQTGTGLLNLGAALRATVAANPVSISFGVGGGTVDLVRSFSVRNVSSSFDTFTITAVPSSEGAVPSISPNTVQLAAGSSQEITVRLQGSDLLAHAYEGVLVVQGTSSDVVARIPYWYAVSSLQASVISVIEPNSTGSTSSRQRLRFRVLDAAGVPILDEPRVTAEQGGGLVLSVESLDSTYPGLFSADVRLGELVGDNVFAIEAGGMTKQIKIVGQ
jgi:hypothetical protein